MGAEKVTTMILKADLQCPFCYKKVKKTLCKFPQIRDQVYNEKTNTVAIVVVCCSPERVRDKLCYKGGKAIKSITIVEPEKPKQPTPEKPKEKPKEAEKPKEKPKADGAPPAEKPKDAPKAEPPKNPEPAAAKPPQQPAQATGVPSIFPYIRPSQDGYNAGPYYHGYGYPPPPPQPCYHNEGQYGHCPHWNGFGPHGHGHGHAHGYGGVAHMNKCDGYFTEENPQACTIM